MPMQLLQISRIEFSMEEAIDIRGVIRDILGPGERMVLSQIR
jgi:hypothetical protein